MVAMVRVKFLQYVGYFMLVRKPPPKRRRTYGADLYGSGSYGI
jgi:hypothetical protein